MQGVARRIAKGARRRLLLSVRAALSGRPTVGAGPSARVESDLYRCANHDALPWGMAAIRRGLPEIGVWLPQMAIYGVLAAVFPLGGAAITARSEGRYGPQSRIRTGGPGFPAAARLR